MKLEEFYAVVGGDYEDTVSRLMNEQIVKKFVTAFINDKSYDEFFENYNAHKNEDAFRAVHTLKGLSLNLGLSVLSDASVVVTEALRDGKNDVTEEMLDELKSAYKITCDAIKQLDL